MPSHAARRLGAAVLAALGTVAAADIPAAAADPSPTDPQLTATGFWELAGGSTTLAAFTCEALATPTALATGIETCVLRRNGTVTASAPGIAAPGPVVATGSATTFPFIGTMSIQVCWSSWAAYVDGTIRTSSGCSSETLL